MTERNQAANGRRSRRLSSVEVEQARALKKVMSWSAIARLYGMNRWTLMYQIMPDEDREAKKARMRETNRAAYARKGENGSPSVRQRYKARYGLSSEKVRALRNIVRDKMKKR